MYPFLFPLHLYKFAIKVQKLIRMQNMYDIMLINYSKKTIKDQQKTVKQTVKQNQSLQEAIM